MLKHWISQLNADTEAQRARERAQRNEKARVEAQAARERLTPLDERLTRLLATILVELQREGLSLSSLQASLHGRSRGNCHPGELGGALRRLGLQRGRKLARRRRISRGLVSKMIGRAKTVCGPVTTT